MTRKLLRTKQGERRTDLYVVLLVTLTHHAVVYEIPTAAAPENAIANKRKLRVSSGLSYFSFSTDSLGARRNTLKLTNS